MQNPLLRRPLPPVLEATEASSLDALCSGYAVLFVQLLTMTRASSVSAGLELEGPGIRHDLAFDDVGMT